MNAWGTKALIAAVLAIICVLIGIEIAAMGIERVQGPLLTGEPAAVRTPIAVIGDAAAAREAARQAAPRQAASASAVAPAEAAADAARSPAAGAAAVTGIAAAADVEPTSFIYRFSLWLGDTLRYVAKGVLRFIAAVFDAAIH